MLLLHDASHIPVNRKGAVVAIGNFDGVHRGHQTVLDEARAHARALGAPLAVLSFEPHPRQVFQPEAPPFRLTPMPVRARLLRGLGVDLHVVLSFDIAFSRKSADAFVQDILVDGFGARHVVIGYDFCFGHQRQGNARTLQGFGADHGFGVSVVTKASDESGGIYSSSRVRDLLRAGDMAAAADVLGRLWTVEGEVRHGDKRGRELGYPTANVDLGAFLPPAYGVYAVRVAIDPTAGDPETSPADATGLTWIDGVANLGIRPMYRLDSPLLEAFLFDFDGDLYGRHLRVQLVERLRGEMAFDGIEPLIAQMDIDSAKARAGLGSLDPMWQRGLS